MITQPRRALVTGVAGGIGSAIAERLRSVGWAVLGIDRNEPPDGLCDRFELFDIGRWRELGDVVERLVGPDPLGLLVNNAGTQIVAPILDLDDDALEETFAVNTFAPFVAIRSAGPMLGAGRGAVVSIASVHAVATSAGMSAYAASKAAIVALTKAAAIELAPMGVRVNAVLPGAIATQMLQSGLEGRPGSEEAGRKRLASATPLGRIGLAAEVADLVEYLADSARSSFVTGQSFVVDGGALARLGTE